MNPSVTTITSRVLIMEAVTIGQNSEAMTSKVKHESYTGRYEEEAQVGNQEVGHTLTQCSLIQPNFKKRVSSSIPIMLEGSLIPVK